MITYPTIEELKTLKGIIYLIRNKIDNKCYIGQTTRTFYQRYDSGKWWKYTSNKYLKNAVNKYGVENFQVIILESELINQDELNKGEIDYSKEYNSLIPNGYNFRECGKNGGYQKDFYEKRLKIFKIVSPEGQIMEIKGFKKFCKNNNLSETEAWKLLDGDIQHCKKWTKYEDNYVNKGYREKCAKYIIKCPDGKEEMVCSIAEFSREHNINPNGLYGVICGKVFSHKGYELIKNLKNPKIKPPMPEKLGKFHRFISLEGDLICIHNLSKFCRDNNLNKSSMSRVQGGQLKQHKGYTSPNSHLWLKYLDRQKIKYKDKH